MPKIPSPSAIDVVTQLVTGPSIREVASKTLRPALRTLYPDTPIDPQLAMVVRPTWVIEDDRVIPGRPQIESLTDTLVRLGLSGTMVTYLDGEHYLTLQPDRPAAVQLPVKISAIGKLLNELAPVLFIAYKEQHVNYWDDFTYPGQPRWQQLSQALRNLWNLDANTQWDADQRAMVAAVYKHPDKHERLPADKYKTRACLIDIDRDDGDAESHVILLNTAVLIGTDDKRTLIMTHSVISGFESFESLEKLGEALPRRYWKGASSAGLKWRLVEPQGNFFDYQACTLIALEADALGDINFFQGSSSRELYPHTGTFGDPREPTPRLKPHIEHLHPMLPPWLDSAAPADQTRFSRHLLDLATVQHSNNGKTFQSEVVDLQTFTRDALKKQMLKDHPTAGEVKIDNIEISTTSLVVWGTFVLPGNTQTLTLSLIELALQNLAGQPIGNKTVRYKDGSELPEWMSASYLEQLVSRVNIGKTYPAHLQNLLVDDSEQAARLQELYTSQLPIELPLLALQHKIQGKAGITEQGYRYVVAALANTGDERYVDREEIVIRPLAFVAHRTRSTADTVNNMFVIGPREVDKGPCLLYRPLFEMALMQFPSHANLLYEIQHSRSLRESVLAWLPDDVRFNYSQFVFTARLPSIWTIPQLLVNPATALDMSGVVALGTATIDHFVLSTLHESNVQAVLMQADRQSVSDAEACWATLKHGGWLIFNAALPFLGRSVGTAAWIWQIMDDLQEVSDVANEQSGKTAWAAIADILLALGMVLAHRAALGDKPHRESINIQEPPQIKTSERVVGKPLQLPDVSSSALPAAHEMSVNPFAALKRSPVALAALLDSFQIAKPTGMGAVANEGSHRYLYPRQKQWYAPVGSRWFEVTLNEHEEVQIIDSRQQPPLKGPTLARTAGGQWVIDLRLRLRGGGPDSALKKIQDFNKMSVRKLTAKISAFDTTMQAKQTQRNADHAAFEGSPAPDRAKAREKYLATLDSQHKAYGTSIEQIRALNHKEPIPNYRIVMTERLEMQLFLGQECLAEHSTELQDNLKTIQTMLANEAGFAAETFVQTFEKMTDLTQAIIEKMESAESRFKELTRLGQEAGGVIHKYRKMLPGYDLNDLKLLQISLGQEICLKTGETTTDASAYQRLSTLIEDAALNIQSTLNLTADESLANLRERTDTLNSVTEQFTAIDQRFGDLLIDYPEQIDKPRFELVRSRVIAFKAPADKALADLLRYKHLLAPVPGPSRPASTSTTRRIIKTKSRGTLVGVRKKSIEGLDTDQVEVRTNLTGVIATFQEESPGVWVEQRAPKPKPKPPKTSPNLKKSILEGQALIDGLAAFHRRIEAQIKLGPRIPVAIEEDYHRHAAILRKANAAIDEALTASNLTADLKKPTEELGHKLDETAKALVKKGTSTRIRLVKQQPPTAAGVQWLKDEGEVTISQTVTRHPLKSHANDFLDEYKISDAHTGEPLCYAHFHYSSVQAPVAPFPPGHMKTVAQQYMRGAYEPRHLSDQALIAIHRSYISDKSARALFVTTAMPVAAESALL